MISTAAWRTEWQSRSPSGRVKSLPPQLEPLHVLIVQPLVLELANTYYGNNASLNVPLISDLDGPLVGYRNAASGPDAGDFKDLLAVLAEVVAEGRHLGMVLTRLELNRVCESQRGKSGGHDGSDRELHDEGVDGSNKRLLERLL